MGQHRDNVIIARIAKNIRRIRKEKKMTIETVAFESKMQYSQVFRIENAISNPTISTLTQVSKGLGIGVKDLL